MAVDLIVSYKAEVDDLTNKLKVVIDRLDSLEKESKSAAKGLDETTKAADKLDKELSTAGKSTKTATDNIKNFSKTSKTELNALSSSVKSIGLSIASAIGAAFTVDAVIQFGKASVNAFLEAQENAEKLRFTITQVGGESERAFQRLIDQSAQLQDITIFSDDSIQQAQNALATFGLTAQQIEELIPKLADFASATKTDIVQAAQQVGAGLQGAGREFKKYGIEVSATATEIENLSAITDGFAKFQGSAAKETETLTGQLKQQANAADELQESIGSRLAPVFVQFRIAVYEAVLGLLGFNKALDDIEKDKTSALSNNFEQTADKIRKSGGDIVAVFEERLEKIKKSNEEIIESNNKLTESLGSRQVSQLQKNLAREQIEANNEIIKQNEIKIKQIQNIIDREAEQANAIDRTLNAEKLRVLSIEELNALLAENKKLNDIYASSNITLINRELEARKKLVDEAKKNADVRKAGTESEIKLLESLSAEYKDLLKLLSESQKQQLIELGIKADVDIEAFKAEVAKLVAQNQTEITVPLVLEPRVDDVAFNDGLDNIENEVVITNEMILDSTSQMLSQLTGLYNDFANQRIDDAQKAADSEIENIDKSLQANDEALKNRRISEREAANEKIRLEAEKVKAEQAADKKIRAIKRQQAIINKIAAIAEIAISTAKNVAEFPALTAFYLAIGAAQAAIVAAQPIPYKKGSKKTKEGLARVGEEGEEIVFMPGGSKVLPNKQTKTYGAALDAMFDNRFDKWVIDNYAPKLIAQQKVHKEAEVKSFSKNLADSLTVNVAAPMASRKNDKVTMANVDELAEAIVRSSYISPYRR